MLNAVLFLNQVKICYILYRQNGQDVATLSIWIKIGHKNANVDKTDTCITLSVSYWIKKKQVH